MQKWFATLPVMSSSFRNPILAALDVPSQETATQLSQILQPYVGGFKVGLELFCSTGPGIVETIGPQNLFLDLKLHDIPNTVAATSRVLTKLGVWMFNVHCLGGKEMMRAAVEAARAEREDAIVIGVTILTSHDAAALTQLGLDEEPAQAVRRLALLAREAGLQGVVCSPMEIEAVRVECGNDFLLVTPGVRPAGAKIGDQKRVMTPRAAMDAGADWLVLGRPITAADDLAQAARDIVTELRQ